LQCLIKSEEFMRVVPIAILAAVVCGCYSYGDPPQAHAVAPGIQIRMQLTGTGTDSLARFLGPNVASVDGRLIVANTDSYEVGVTEVVMHSGMEQYWKGESVTLPKPFVANIQERQFSWGKSGLLAGFVVLTAIALNKTGALDGVLGGGKIGSPQ
jgi:hypothetical protein